MKLKLRTLMLAHLAGLMGPLQAADPAESLRAPGHVREHGQGDPQTDLDLAFDDDCVVIPHATRDLKPQPGHASPMIQEGEFGFVCSEHFQGMTETLAIMNQLAYKRGRDPHGADALAIQARLGSWTFDNVAAIRGWNEGRYNDRGAGFVAFDQGRNTVAIVMHGSMDKNDWGTNLKSFSRRISDVAMPDGRRLPMEGHAHEGFLAKFASCMPQIRQHLDLILAGMAPAQRADLKIYVSGHSQGAALAQLIGVAVCQHLETIDPGFENAEHNRVHLWLLSTPAGLDAAAKAFAEKTVGKRNMLVQNSWLDLVPNLGLTFDLGKLDSAGSKALQSSREALDRAERARQQAKAAFEATGGTVAEDRGFMSYVTAPLSRLNAFIRNQHLGSQHEVDAEGRLKYGFDPRMVDQAREDLNESLQRAYDQEQSKLRAGSTWNPVSWLYHRFGGY